MKGSDNLDDAILSAGFKSGYLYHCYAQDGAFRQTYREGFLKGFEYANSRLEAKIAEEFDNAILYGVKEKR